MSKSTLPQSTVRALAHRGAVVRVQELQLEIATLLDFVRRGQAAQAAVDRQLARGNGDARRGYTWTPAQRQAMAARMKARWRAARKAGRSTL